MSRARYGRLLSMPAWGLYDDDGNLIATLRAENAEDAKTLFITYGYHGDDVRPMTTQ